MYLIICKNKYGLSVDNYSRYKSVAEEETEERNKHERFGNTYHVREFDLASIDLDKLMENKQ